MRGAWDEQSRRFLATYVRMSMAQTTSFQVRTMTCSSPQHVQDFDLALASFLAALAAFLAFFSALSRFRSASLCREVVTAASTGPPGVTLTPAATASPLSFSAFFSRFLRLRASSSDSSNAVVPGICTDSSSFLNSAFRLCFFFSSLREGFPACSSRSGAWHSSGAASVGRAPKLEGCLLYRPKCFFGGGSAVGTPSVVHEASYVLVRASCLLGCLPSRHRFAFALGSASM
mmetsp:Transcript_6853/g.14345  ORF Transcript_6853/g.14345 Transcript_6853/m.14345 type:complete len:231 (-) Transcript_6853:159-851(-)